MRDLYRLLYLKQRELEGKIVIKIDEPLTCLMAEQSIPKGLPRRCEAGVWSLEITPDGWVMPCYALYIKEENIRKRTIQEIWLHSDLFRKVRDHSLIKGKCQRCKYFEICGGGCRGIAYLLNGDMFTTDPLCWYEPE